MVSTGPTDAALLAMSAAGDRDAFDTLVERHATALFRYAVLSCRSACDAETAVREGLLAAWRRVATASGELSARTWLLQAIVEACREPTPLPVPSVPAGGSSADDVSMPTVAGARCSTAKLSCDEAQARLSEYLDGDLDATDRACLEQHLERCSGCAADCDELRLTVEALHAHLLANPRLRPSSRAGSLDADGPRMLLAPLAIGESLH